MIIGAFMWCWRFFLGEASYRSVPWPQPGRLVQEAFFLMFFWALWAVKRGFAWGNCLFCGLLGILCAILKPIHDTLTHHRRADVLVIWFGLHDVECNAECNAECKTDVLTPNTTCKIRIWYEEVPLEHRMLVVSWLYVQSFRSTRKKLNHFTKRSTLPCKSVT